MRQNLGAPFGVQWLLPSAAMLLIGMGGCGPRLAASSEQGSKPGEESTSAATVAESAGIPASPISRLTAPTAVPVASPQTFGRDPPAAARVRVIDDAFQPEIARLAVGEIVEWQHAGFRLHTVTAVDLSWSSGAFMPGETFRVSFAQPGEYQYVCQDHPWMIGQVVVTDPTSAHAHD